MRGTKATRETSREELRKRTKPQDGKAEETYNGIVMWTKVGSMVDGEPSHASSLGGAPVGMLGEGTVYGHAIPLIWADKVAHVVGDVLGHDHAVVKVADRG